MTTLGTVTTVGGSYSRYITEWADRIVAQTRRPDRIVIVDNGTNDPHLVVEAADRLDAHLTVLPWTVNYGRARNIGIAATGTEWVHHADVDDLLYPHAIEETHSYMYDADVIGWGWDRTGHTRRLTRLYGTHQGNATLVSPGPASGLSPFRRRLWEQRPYRDDMPAAWDTSLWRGFGHLNARFVGTTRPMFAYRYHPDSLFHSRVKAKDPQQVGVRLGQLATRWPHETVVVVPWRDPGCPHRRAAWEWCKARWAVYGYPIVEADCEGPWNKPRALNETISRLDCRTLIVADADVAIPPERAAQAVQLAQHLPWIVPHTTTQRLDQPATDTLLKTGVAQDGRVMPPYRSVPGGGLFVLTRAQWHHTYGMDPAFTGWGAEDEAWAAVADTLIGPHHRLDGDLTHLYHPPGLRTGHPTWQANRALYGQYRKATTRGRDRLTRFILDRRNLDSYPDLPQQSPEAPLQPMSPAPTEDTTTTVVQR